MTGQAMGWPDKDKPGEPENPEMSPRWHVMERPDGMRTCAMWVHGATWWDATSCRHDPPRVIAHRWPIYLGPAYTRADLLAAQAEGAAAGEARGIERAAEALPALLDEATGGLDPGADVPRTQEANLAWYNGALAALRVLAEAVPGMVRALPVPTQPALDAALERARAEGERRGIERAAEIAESTCWLGYRFTGGGALAKEIRALPPSPALVAADGRVRDAALEEAAAQCERTAAEFRKAGLADVARAFDSQAKEIRTRARQGGNGA